MKFVMNVTVTAYNPGDKRQCYGKTKEELNTGAWGDKIKHGDIALSPDILKHPQINKYDYVCLEFTDEVHCGIVKDKMGMRGKRVDLAIKRKSLKESRKEAREFGKKKAKLFVKKGGK